MAIQGEIGFHVGTYAEYKAKKDASTLIASDFYFTTDTKEMFIGADKYCESYKVVSTFPSESPIQGIIYINETTYEAKIWNGTAWQVVSPAIVSVMGDDLTAVPTVGAVKTYVADQSGTPFITKIEHTYSTDLTVTNGSLKADVKVSGNDPGNVIITTTLDGLRANVEDATNTIKGVIRVATDEEVTAGTLENVAINPKQLLASQVSATSFRGDFDASNGNFTSIQDADPKIGDVWAISVAGTIDAVEYNVGDLLYVTKVIPAEAPAKPTITVVKIDNTESADIVRLNLAQTLTNKTISAADNTLSNIVTSNFASAALSTTIAETSVDTKIPTEKAVKSYVDAQVVSATVNWKTI